MENAEAVANASIPVENIKGPVMLVSGGDDQMWPSAKFSEMVMERLKNSNFPYRFEHLYYPEAGHVIGAPHAPATVTASFHPIRKLMFAYGGHAKAYAHAAEDSWTKSLAFLKQSLK